MSMNIWFPIPVKKKKKKTVIFTLYKAYMAIKIILNPLY